MKAIWNDTLLAESNKTLVIEGNHYFPHEAINQNYFKPSNTKTHCPWKGEASYYDIEANGKTNEDAAWFYPETKHAANSIKNYVAFWKGVKITE
tara:strand:- start:14143 stop:14424 length:282 start_codon:yes stop_codon:yes gene_type:complete